jgi:hypothetical protein
VIRYRHPRWFQIAAALFSWIPPFLLLVGVFESRPWWLVAVCFLPLGAMVAIAHLRGSQIPADPTEPESR